MSPWSNGRLLAGGRPVVRPCARPAHGNRAFVARCLFAEVNGFGEVLGQVDAFVQAEAGPGARARAVAEVKDVQEVLSQVPKNVSHMRVGMVRQPNELLPTVGDIEQMSSQESGQRTHWFVGFFFLEFICVALVGTVVMAWPRCRDSSGVPKGYERLCNVEAPPEQAEEVPDWPSRLDEEQQRLLVSVAFGITVLCSFGACLFSLKTQRLSKDTGLDWEVYALLLLILGAGLVSQAVAAVSSLPKGSYFKLTSFAEATALSMAPLLSDAYDTLKDAVFGALCLESNQVGIQCMGVLAWIYLVGIHIYFVSNKQCLAELASTYLPVLLSPAHTASEPPPQDQSCCVGMVLPLLYKQMTPTKCKLLCIENGPQAIFAIIYLYKVGGSMFIGLLNLAVPAAQILLALALFEPVRAIVVPSLAQKLSEALSAGNTLAAQRIWEEARSQSVAAKDFRRQCRFACRRSLMMSRPSRWVCSSCGISWRS